MAAACCILLAVAGRPAHGIVDSIETMVANADVVAVVTLRDVWRVEDESHWPRSRAVIRFEEVVRGAPPAETTLLVPAPFEGGFTRWKRYGG